LWRERGVSKSGRKVAIVASEQRAARREIKSAIEGGVVRLSGR
jgi:hypothetical protein